MNPKKEDGGSGDLIPLVPSGENAEALSDADFAAIGEETRDKTREIVDKRVAEMAVLGWLHIHAIDSVVGALNTRKDWSSLVVEQVRQCAEQCFEDEDFTHFFALLDALGESPLPRLQERIVHALQRGDFKAAQQTRSAIPWTHQKNYNMPDGDLIVCARMCREQNNPKDAISAISRVAHVPDTKAAEEWIAFVLENGEAFVATELCTRWGITSFQSIFLQMGRDHLSEEDVSSALHFLQAAAFDLKAESEESIKLLELARANLTRIKKADLNIFSDNPENRRRLRDYSGSQEAVKAAGTADDVVELAMNDLNELHGTSAHGSLWSSMESAHSVSNVRDIVALLKGSSVQQEVLRQRLLECGEFLILDALRYSRASWMEIGTDQKGRDSETAEKLETAREIFSLPDINPSAVHIAKLVKAYFYLGNQDAARALIESFGEPVKVQLISDPKNTPLAIFAFADKRPEMIAHIRGRVKNGNFKEAIDACIEWLEQDEIDAMRPVIRKRVANELRKVREKMGLEKKKSLGEQKTQWGKGNVHRKWNDSIVTAIDAYGFIVEPVPTEITSILHDLALLEQQAVIDRREGESSIHSWDPNSLNTAQRIFECLARQELTLPPAWVSPNPTVKVEETDEKES